MPVRALGGTVTVVVVGTSASATDTDCTPDSDPFANGVPANLACTDRTPAVDGDHAKVATPDAFS